MAAGSITRRPSGHAAQQHDGGRTQQADAARGRNRPAVLRRQHHHRIAERLHRSVQTVSTQKRSAMRKLGVSRDVDLIKMYTGGVRVPLRAPFHRRDAVAPGILSFFPWSLFSRRPFRL